MYSNIFNYSRYLQNHNLKTNATPLHQYKQLTLNSYEVVKYLQKLYRFCNIYTLWWWPNIAAKVIGNQLLTEGLLANSGRIS